MRQSLASQGSTSRREESSDGAASCDIIIYCEIPSLQWRPSSPVDCLDSNEVLPSVVFPRKDLEKNIVVYLVESVLSVSATLLAVVSSLNGVEQ